MTEPKAKSEAPGGGQQSDCCSADGGHALTESEVADDVKLLATLGSDTRYETLRLIAGADEDPCVCEIEPALGVSQGAVSQALSRLFGAGLVERPRRRGVVPPPALLAALDQPGAEQPRERQTDCPLAHAERGLYLTEIGRAHV